AWLPLSAPWTSTPRPRSMASRIPPRRSAKAPSPAKSPPPASTPTPAITPTARADRTTKKSKQKNKRRHHWRRFSFNFFETTLHLEPSIHQKNVSSERSEGSQLQPAPRIEPSSYRCCAHANPSGFFPVGISPITFNSFKSIATTLFFWLTAT